MGLMGLGGGSGTGKSTVAEMRGSRGAVVVDAGRRAREVVEPGTAALTAIVAEFGEGVLDGEGRLDRALLGSVVFADPEQRRRLEGITQRAIGTLMQEGVAAAVQASPPLVAVDIPLLFETHRQGMFEGVLLVYADESTQLHRIAARDGLSESEARRRLSAQMPIDDKRRLSPWVIDNNGGLAETEHHVPRCSTDVSA